ncbi:MAG: hypothetical protein NT091_04320 [Candidatus Falkowbacteria bacterium]|nr:hypothetical protein [Candidatus Falkowbacteria bacterium]
MSKLLQVKVQEDFLEKLKQISSHYSLNVSSFVKFVLAREIKILEKNVISFDADPIEEKEFYQTNANDISAKLDPLSKKERDYYNDL